MQPIETRDSVINSVEWHPVVKSKVPGKALRFKLELPNHIKNISNVIYAFWNQQNGKVLVGETAAKVKYRAGSYISDVNTGRKSGQSPLAVDIRTNCSVIFFAVIKVLSASESLKVEEDRYINLFDSLKNGYNRRRGGGGGGSRVTAKTVRVYKKIFKVTSPEKIKFYPLRVKPNGIPVIDWTPSKKDSQDGIYLIKREAPNGISPQTLKMLNPKRNPLLSRHLRTPSSPSRSVAASKVPKTIINVGASGDPIHRVYNHLWDSSRTGEPGDKLLSQQIKKYPGQFSAAIVAAGQPDYEDLENQYINSTAQTSLVYNIRQGGGGSRRR